MVVSKMMIVLWMTSLSTTSGEEFPHLEATRTKDDYLSYINPDDDTLLRRFDPEDSQFLEGNARGDGYSNRASLLNEVNQFSHKRSAFKNAFHFNRNRDDLSGQISSLPEFNPFKESRLKVWDQDPVSLHKKNHEFFEGPVGSGMKDYLYYDWGPNPTIWGSMRQVKPRSKAKSVSVNSENYLNPSYARYGWHSNQNFWGKRSFTASRNYSLPVRNSTLERLREMQDLVLDFPTPHLKPRSDLRGDFEFSSNEVDGHPQAVDFFVIPIGSVEKLAAYVSSKLNLRRVSEGKVKKLEPVIYVPKYRLSLFKQFLNEMAPNSRTWHQPREANMKLESLRGKKAKVNIFDKLQKLQSGAFIPPRG